MPFVELLPPPRDLEALNAYLQDNFRRIQDALALTVGVTDDGDIVITDSTKGLILTAPNGSRYRVTVTNAGALTTTLV